MPDDLHDRAMGDAALRHARAHAVMVIGAAAVASGLGQLIAGLTDGGPVNKWRAIFGALLAGAGAIAADEAACVIARAMRSMVERSHEVGPAVGPSESERRSWGTAGAEPGDAGRCDVFRDD